MVWTLLKTQTTCKVFFTLTSIIIYLWRNVLFTASFQLSGTTFPLQMWKIVIYIYIYKHLQGIYLSATQASFSVSLLHSLTHTYSLLTVPSPSLLLTPPTHQIHTHTRTHGQDPSLARCVCLCLRHSTLIYIMPSKRRLFHTANCQGLRGAAAEPWFSC